MKDESRPSPPPLFFPFLPPGGCEELPWRKTLLWSTNHPVSLSSLPPPPFPYVSQLTHFPPFFFFSVAPLSQTAMWPSKSFERTPPLFFVCANQPDALSSFPFLPKTSPSSIFLTTCARRCISSTILWVFHCNILSFPLTAKRESFSCLSFFYSFKVLPFFPPSHPRIISCRHCPSPFQYD